MKTINFIFGCHSHQPVGNFGFVFEEAYRKSYLPFIEVLERYPAVHVTLHYTGPLLQYLAASQPAFLERVAAMVRSEQVEIMGGGFQEPLLCAIPERDAISQIHAMQHFCEKHFGARPRGMWVAERVWEPQMAGTLSKAGVEYTVLDDTHFICSGVPREALFGYYATEDAGHALKVFPMQERLRYLVPFHQVHETIDYLREHATEEGASCAVLHDDGEKFGVWPGTYDSVYGEGWLEHFFQALTDNQEWLHSVTYSEYLAHASTRGRVYLTCASYEEMMAWALPTPVQRKLLALQKELQSNQWAEERFGAFLRGGFWRGFLSKYAESNNVQKRMLRVSDRLERLKRSHGKSAKEKRTLDEAEALLHEGQCNCAYWHGVFGGLYLNHLRTALYEKLIAADAKLDSLERKGDQWVHCERVDFDADGNDDVVLENSHLALFFNPADGGTLFELDYKPKPFNFCSTLTRREEPYHDQLRSGNVSVGEIKSGDQSIHELIQAKEVGLDSYLCYDPYRRVSLRDIFLPELLPVEALWRHEYEDAGDFATGAYTAEAGENQVSMRREGALVGESGLVLALSKTVTLVADAPAFTIRYDIEYRGAQRRTVCFGSEFAVNLLAGNAFDRYYRSDERDLGHTALAAHGCHRDLGHIALRDDWQGLEFGLCCAEPAIIYHFGLETVSQSEAGQERVYQGSMVIPVWEITLDPGVAVRREMRVEITRVQK